MLDLGHVVPDGYKILPLPYCYYPALPVAAHVLDRRFAAGDLHRHQMGLYRLDKRRMTWTDDAEYYLFLQGPGRHVHFTNSANAALFLRKWNESLHYDFWELDQQLRERLTDLPPGSEWNAHHDAIALLDAFRQQVRLLYHHSKRQQMPSEYQQLFYRLLMWTGVEGTPEVR